MQDYNLSLIDPENVPNFLRNSDVNWESHNLRGL